MHDKINPNWLNLVVTAIFLTVILIAIYHGRKQRRYGPDLGSRFQSDTDSRRSASAFLRASSYRRKQ